MPNENFICLHCGENISNAELIGTHNRNHCPKCLWSKHVDFEKSGDRMADCASLMEPIGLTFKQEGKNKYGKTKQGELMIIHQCAQCGKISLNRIAGDDSEKEILNLLEKPNKLELKEIKILKLEDTGEVERQLFGK
jgi:DNA-directed RNA polymerase subunit RPC12/RpoP